MPLATPGTAMPDGRVIEPKPILGIESDGMLCSARELGLGDDHAGIVILPADTPLGVPYGKALGLTGETVYDLDVTRNLPDCFGYLGVARQIAARLHLPLATRPAAISATDGAPTRQARSNSSTASVRPVHQHCDQRHQCRCRHPTGSRASGRGRNALHQQRRRRQQLRDARTQPTQPRLRPRHARRRRVPSTPRRDGETMVTLDGFERTLIADDLLICDATDTPIGIGGIMGGLDSEISDSTTTIALEIAWFEPISVAKTATRLGLRSEASLRFDRGVDPHGMPAAMRGSSSSCGCTCPDLVVHDGDGGCPVALSTRRGGRSSVRVSRSTRLLGTSLTSEQIRGLIVDLGFAVAGSDPLTVTVPSWRPDCTEEVDIIEEVARQYGYGNVGKTVPKSAMHGRLSPVTSPPSPATRGAAGSRYRRGDAQPVPRR